MLFILTASIKQIHLSPSPSLHQLLSIATVLHRNFFTYFSPHLFNQNIWRCLIRPVPFSLILVLFLLLLCLLSLAIVNLCLAVTLLPLIYFANILALFLAVKQWLRCAGLTTTLLHHRYLLCPHCLPQLQHQQRHLCRFVSATNAESVNTALSTPYSHCGLSSACACMISLGCVCVCLCLCRSFCIAHWSLLSIDRVMLLY